MQRCDDPEPWAITNYIGEWVSHWWSKMPRPPRTKKTLPLDEGEFVFNGATKKWEKK